jgi:deoxyadenosine/deoxycytidine kinase
MLKILSEMFNKDYVEVIQEPVEEWKNLVDTNNRNILSYFYEEPKRWSLSFQLNAFISRVNKLDNLSKDKIYIVERSVFSDKNCFATNCYNSGLMNELEWKIYNHWFDWLISKSNAKPDGYIYLQCDPKTCLDRILIRNRNEENNITLDYLEQLNLLHNEWLLKSNNKTLLLDYNYDFNKNPDRLNNDIKSILNFIEGLSKQRNANILNKLKY